MGGSRGVGRPRARAARAVVGGVALLLGVASAGAAHGQEAEGQTSQEHAAPEQPAQEQTAPEQATAEQAASEQPARDPVPRQPAARRRDEDTVGVASVGAIGLRAEEDPAALVDFEYRFRPRRFRLRPVLGGAATSRGDTYVRVGAGRDLRLADRWQAHIGFATNLYFVGGGKNLGSTVEFRSALDLSYQLRSDLHVGLTVAHLSNAGFGGFNPGVETLALTFAWRQPARPSRRGR